MFIGYLQVSTNQLLKYQLKSEVLCQLQEVFCQTIAEINVVILIIRIAHKYM